MISSPIIALTTDFGWGSPYVAQLQGVLLSALPTARLLDLSHNLPAHDLRAAELFMRRTAFALPLGTTHVVVVDPGVGTDRRGLAVQARGMNFVGPDNGILSVATSQPDARIVQLDNPRLFRQPVSPTFHGRDVFAPVAAELAAGLPFAQIGTPVDDPESSNLPEPRREGKRIVGETLGADRFGNLTTNIPAAELGAELSIELDGQHLHLVRTYGDAKPGTLVVLVGSDGYLEIAVCEGSAVEQLGRDAGCKVSCSTEHDHD